MLIEFSRHGKTYQFVKPSLRGEPPPLKLTIPFKPCVLRDPVLLELEWIGTDDVRMIELYRPVWPTGQPVKETQP
jgi:hypothetical protein